MNIICQENNIILEDVKDFSISQTLECGQCFRFEKIDENEYILIAKSKMLRIKQNNKQVIFYNTSLEDYKDIWEEYFDFKRDYGEIKEKLIKNDPKMEEVISYGQGIRLLNQDFFEILISFIISQNKQIPHIKQIISLMSEKYGDRLGNFNGKDYYSFPSLEQLSLLEEEDFRQLKAGFRSRYLVDAVEKVQSDMVNEEELRSMGSEEALKTLCLIKGVGVKVSNCVLLFGLWKKEAFPVDVWIKRIMEEIYFNEETKLQTIQKFAEEKFGQYGGYAQQYLFYYTREKEGV